MDPFPQNPNVGDKVTLANGITYEWDGNVWIIATSPGQSAEWGHIGGNILDQPDLEAALDEKQELVADAKENSLAFFDNDGQVIDGDYFYDDTLEVTIDIDDLQDTLDGLPRYLNRAIRINLNPGITNETITIEKFHGPGSLRIYCQDTVNQDFDWQVERVIIHDCILPRIDIYGLTTNSTDGVAWSITRTSISSFLFMYRCNAFGGSPTDTTNYGWYANESNSVYCSACSCSDKYIAMWGRSGRFRVGSTLGSNNTIGFSNSYAGIIQITNAPPVAFATTMYNRANAGITITSRGDVLTPVTTTVETLTVDIEDLQAAINGLPKNLQRPVTINVNPGEITTAISIDNFTGQAAFQILGANAVDDFSRKVLRVSVNNCNFGYLYIRGISATATTGNGFYINQCVTPFALLTNCNAAGDGSGTPGAGGNPATSTNFGIYCYRSNYVWCATCNVSDKHRAFYGRQGTLVVEAPRGAGNAVVFNSEIAGQLHVYSRGTCQGTEEYRAGDSGFLIRNDGEIITSYGVSYRRRTSDLNLIFYTDTMSSQSLAATIERSVQESIFVHNTSTYTLRIIIMQGAGATIPTLRIMGLNLRYAYIHLFIEPGVTLASMDIYGNRSMNFVINNCGNVNGNITIGGNHTHWGDIGYNQNYAATVAPTYPSGHPLSGQLIPLQSSRVTGGILITKNVAATHIYAVVGQHCVIGTISADGVVAAPSVGSNTSGTIQLVLNNSLDSCYVIVYATYSELDPVLPGPVVASSIYVYYNECGGTAYCTVQSGWRQGTQPTVGLTQVYYNKTGTNCYINIGNGRPATTFVGYWTAVAEADPSTANRTTVVLTADMLPGREASVVGMGFTFVNASTASSASNYSGTFKRVTAYDPATRTVTLSANFNLPRPAGQTVYFFPYAAQTNIYYGTSVKIEAMLSDAYDTGQPYGLRLADGNNLGRAYQITAIDKTLKTITISPGLNANGVYNSSFTPCGTFSPITVMDYVTDFNKIAPNTIRSTGDHKFYPYVDRMLLGQRITGPGITGSALVTHAEFGGVGFESRIILELDSDPAVETNNSVYSYTIRRAPGNGHYGVAYNQCGTDAIINVGYPGAAENGGIRLRSAIVIYNQCGGSAYLNMNDFMGNVINQNGAVRCGYVDNYYNRVGYSCYVAARANNSAGGDGNLTRIRSYGNFAGYDCYLVIGAHTTVWRETIFYNNHGGYRCYVDCDLPGGVTISATTAPQLKAYLQCHRNTAPHVWVNRLNIKPALLAETGRATDVYALLMQDINGRAYVGSASLWLDISNNTAANSTCLYAYVCTNFEYGFAVPSVYDGTQTYALRVVDCPNARISARPATNPKIQITGYTQAHMGSTIATDNIYKADHTGGRDDNVAVLKGGHWLEDTDITGV